MVCIKVKKTDNCWGFALCEALNVGFKYIDKS